MASFPTACYCFVEPPRTNCSWHDPRAMPCPDCPADLRLRCHEHDFDHRDLRHQQACIWCRRAKRPVPDDDHRYLVCLACAEKAGTCQQCGQWDYRVARAADDGVVRCMACQDEILAVRWRRTPVQ